MRMVEVSLSIVLSFYVSLLPFALCAMPVATSCILNFLQVLDSSAALFPFWLLCFSGWFLGLLPRPLPV